MSISYNTSIIHNGLILHLDADNPKSYPSTGIVLTDLSGKGQKLYVEDIRDNKVNIANDGTFAGDPHCFYLVQSEYVDINKMQVEIE